MDLFTMFLNSRISFGTKHCPFFLGQFVVGVSDLNYDCFHFMLAEPICVLSLCEILPMGRYLGQFLLPLL